MVKNLINEIGQAMLGLLTFYFQSSDYQYNISPHNDFDFSRQIVPNYRLSVNSVSLKRDCIFS